MRVCVVLEQRFCEAPDGSRWTQGGFARPFWDRYLRVFDRVRIVARVRPVEEPPPASDRADGDGIEFAGVPHYLGPWEYVARAAGVRRAVRRAIGAEDAVVLRIPSHLAGLAFSRLRRAGQPYAVEVVGDPYEVFAPGALRHPLRPFFRWWFTRVQRLLCRQASAAAYVTAKTIQRRYPPRPGAFTVHCSSVELAGRMAGAARHLTPKPTWTLLTVGSLAQRYKGTDVLIDAVARCRRDGADLRLTIVGDGKHREELQRRAARSGAGAHIVFRGQVPAGEAVRAEMERADLFVLPSRTEGLPRAMIEAMAQALPCIGSCVGGIPELLPPEDLFPPNDAAALAGKIREVLADPDRMTRMSERNLEKVGEYREEALAERRRAFYERAREATAEWLGRQERLGA